jgi:hypothetical protein
MEGNGAIAKPVWKPFFLREIEQRAEEVGMLAATHEILCRDGISVNAEGDIERLQEHAGGLLLVGDHKYRWEFVAAMSLMHRLGRPDVLHIVKFYVERQIGQALGNVAAQQVLPVYPRLLARDRPEFWNTETFNRIAYHRRLLDARASAKANEQAIQIAARRLEASGVVNILPCGGVVDGTRAPWRSGLGRMMNVLSEAACEDVLVVPYRVQPVQNWRLIAAIALRGRGLAGTPQTMVMEIGHAKTVKAYQVALPTSETQNVASLTALVREQFLADFARECESAR